MWEKIEKLRQKQDHEKQRIAFSISLIVTIIITIIWFSTFSLDSNAVAANTSSPFQEFKKSFTTLFSSKTAPVPTQQ